MTHVSALLRRTDEPHIADMAEASRLDAAAMAHEWAKGNDLSMISHQTVATENIARILLMAASAALKDAGDGAMGQLLEAYIAGRVAEMQFAHRNHWTGDALETSAADLEGLAEEIAARFRKDAEGLAA